MGVRLNPEKGSKQEGLKMFKERFGGELHQGYMWKYSFNLVKYALYASLARIRHGGDVVDQERRKASVHVRVLNPTSLPVKSGKLSIARH